MCALLSGTVGNAFLKDFIMVMHTPQQKLTSHYIMKIASIMLCVMIDGMSASYASDDVVCSLRIESPLTDSPIVTRTLGREHFFKIAKNWKMDITYVEGVYKALSDKKFVRVDALHFLKEKSVENKPRENFMRYKLVDRLMNEHMNVFGQRIVRTHTIPGAGSIEIHEFVGLSSKELTTLNAKTVYDQDFLFACDEALRDADFDYRRALDIAMKRGPHTYTFKGYRQLAAQVDECITLLFSVYAQKTSYVQKTLKG